MCLSFILKIILHLFYNYTLLMLQILKPSFLTIELKGFILLVFIFLIKNLFEFILEVHKMFIYLRKYIKLPK